jgi:O-antigen ligase
MPRIIVSRAWLFPLGVFGFAAAGIAGLDRLFTPATRWLPLVALALFLLSRARLFLAFRTPIAPAMAAWMIWVLLTTLWSEVPLLSFMKGAALVLTVVPLVSGGLYWARYAKPDDPLSYLAPLTALTLFAAVFGFGIFRYINGGVAIFEGLSTNANAFGSLIAIGLPYPLCAAYRARAHWPRMILWIGVALALLVLLVLTRSRAAALIALCTLVAFALVALPRKSLAIGALAGLLLVGAVAALPPLRERVAGPVRALVDKNNDDPLLSRRELWRRSYEYAARGGVVGMGYGVSTDARARFAGGATAVGYAREKGSSQLAIVEETGLIGLGIYALLIAQLFLFLISRTAAAAKRETRLAAGLLTGALAGIVLQSVFEGWWTAPGSLQSIFFWSTAGAAIGILRHPRSASPELQ